MPTDIFEGAPIALKGEITAGHEAATSVTFVLKRDGAALRTVSATIDGRKAEATTPAPTAVAAPTTPTQASAVRRSIFGS